jgi:hypothetical protein
MVLELRRETIDYNTNEEATTTRRTRRRCQQPWVSRCRKDPKELEGRSRLSLSGLLFPIHCVKKFVHIHMIGGGGWCWPAAYVAHTSAERQWSRHFGDVVVRDNRAIRWNMILRVRDCISRIRRLRELLSRDHLPRWHAFARPFLHHDLPRWSLTL